MKKEDFLSTLKTIENMVSEEWDMEFTIYNIEELLKDLLDEIAYMREERIRQEIEEMVKE